jgi:hypothetical protein
LFFGFKSGFKSGFVGGLVSELGFTETKSGGVRKNGQKMEGLDKKQKKRRLYFDDLPVGDRWRGEFGWKWLLLS